MADNNTRVSYLVQQYANNTCSRAELLELLQCIASAEQEALLQESLTTIWQQYQYNDLLPELDKEVIFQNSIQAAIPPKTETISRISWKKYIAVAAVIILLLGSGVYIFNRQSYKSNKSSQITVQTTDIPPGTDKAIWILADGKQIELDSTVLDMTANKARVENTGYNELRTPNGGQYQLILPDGSKVWLNAASSIKYPVVFDGAERRVEVTGEVYFEIVKDASKPFKVTAGGQKIDVLGTSFNVNIYDDEPSKKTTLVSGSIKISINNQTAILKPGQQANIPFTPITKIKQITVQTTNIEQDLAWKNGLFDFNNLSGYQAMRQIARWYNVNIQYEGNLNGVRLGGEMDRSLTLQQLLRGLEGIEGMHFKLEKNTLIIKR